MKEINFELVGEIVTLSLIVLAIVILIHNMKRIRRLEDIIKINELLSKDQKDGLTEEEDEMINSYYKSIKQPRPTK